MEKFATKNRLYAPYCECLHYAKKLGLEIYPGWETWDGFWNWALAHGYDHTYTLRRSRRTPFTPEYTTLVLFQRKDYEYIAYHSNDRYELPIASASSMEKLSEILKKCGYDYNPKTIKELIGHKRPPTQWRKSYRLVFERVDLTNYDEDDEPFEVKEHKRTT